MISDTGLYPLRYWKHSSSSEWKYGFLKKTVYRKEVKLLQNQLDIWGFASSFALLLHVLEPLAEVNACVNSWNAFTEKLSFDQCSLSFHSHCYMVKVSPCPHPHLGFYYPVNVISYFSLCSAVSHILSTFLSLIIVGLGSHRLCFWNEAFSISLTLSWDYSDELSKELWS